MRNSTEILALMKAIDANNENMRYKIASNMKDREKLLQELIKVEEAEQAFAEKKGQLKIVEKHL